MSAVQLVGRTTNFYGHTLWEIVGNLRDFGVGRVIVRKTFQRYPEPCYYRILQVEAINAPPTERDYRKVRIMVEKTWRGVTSPNPMVIFSSSYKPDYELIPKDEESKYLCTSKRLAEKIIPQKIDLPPLLREYVIDETDDQRPMMNVHFKKTDNKFARVAKENEKPTIAFTSHLEIPNGSKLYESVL